MADDLYLKHIEDLTKPGIQGDGEGEDDDVQGDDQDDELRGGSGDDRVSGGRGNDRLDGGDGNDELDGGDGDDDMAGGTGNDTYRVNSAGDRVHESRGHGHDHVVASVDYTLGANLEDLELEGSARNGYGNRGSNDISGNGEDNHLEGRGGNDTVDGGIGDDDVEGNDGNDSVDGGTGDDEMSGGRGDDTYLVDSDGDHVLEGRGHGGGEDTVRSSVSYTLDANVERLVLTGTDDIDGTGNALKNTLVGNAGDNRLDGGAGGDKLVGGDGADTFVFSSDTLSRRDVDRVADFHTGQDHLEFNHEAFTALGAAGALDESMFHEGRSAETADQHILYDQASGKLYYDADGSGDGAAHLIARLGAGTELHASDIVIG